MKLTRRQLNRIITESLGIQHVSESKKILNYNKMRKDLFALEKNIDDQTLLDKVSNHISDLNDKVEAGEGVLGKKRYREAVTLLRAMKAIMETPTPTPAAVKKAIEKVPDEQPAKQKPTPKPEVEDKDKWNPDPDPKVGWEYQNRDCIWYARKKGTEKEFKLGHASGSPALRGGKFLNSIVKLNKEYRDLVKDCDPLLKKPTPKPKPKPNQPDPDPKPSINTEMSKKYFRTLGDNNDLSREVVQRLNVDPAKLTSTSLVGALSIVAPNASAAIKSYFDDKKIKDKLKTMSEKNAWDVTNEIATKVLNPRGINVLATAADPRVVSFCVQVGDKIAIGTLTQTDLGGTINVQGEAPSKGFEQPKFPAIISKDIFKSSGSQGVQSEGLSRGSLYRRRYYGRY